MRAVVLLLVLSVAEASSAARVAIFRSPGFPTVDAPVIAPAVLASAIDDAEFLEDRVEDRREEETEERYTDHAGEDCDAVRGAALLIVVGVARPGGAHGVCLSCREAAGVATLRVQSGKGLTRNG